MADNVDPSSKPKPSGLQNLFWPLALVALGAYGLYRGSNSTTSFVADIALIAFGLLGLALRAFLKSAGPAADPSSAADVFARQQQTLYSGLHEYRDATDADFRPLSRAFYDATTADLTSAGFRPVRDIVNVTASNVWPRNHAVLRCFLGDGNTTMAAVYHLRIYGLIRGLQFVGVIPRKLQSVEFETELNDGTFVTTANDAASNKTVGYPFVDRQQFPTATPRPQLIESHRAHVKSVLASKPGVQPVRLQNYADHRASQDRMHLLKSAHRRSPNFDYRAEWQKIAGRPLRGNELELADRVADVMQTQDRQEVPKP